MAIAIEWSTRLMTIGLEMALPAAGGYWLDRRVGTSPVFVILGAILVSPPACFTSCKLHDNKALRSQRENVRKESGISCDLVGWRGTHRRGRCPAFRLGDIWQSDGVFRRRGGRRSVLGGSLDRFRSERATPQATTDVGLGPRGHDDPHGNPPGGRVAVIISLEAP